MYWTKFYSKLNHSPSGFIILFGVTRPKSKLVAGSPPRPLTEHTNWESWVSVAKCQQKCSPFQCITFLSQPWKRPIENMKIYLRVLSVLESAYRLWSEALRLFPENRRGNLASDKTHRTNPGRASALNVQISLSRHFLRTFSTCFGCI